MMMPRCLFVTSLVFYCVFRAISLSMLSSGRTFARVSVLSGTGLLKNHADGSLTFALTRALGYLLRWL